MSESLNHALIWHTLIQNSFSYSMGSYIFLLFVREQQWLTALVTLLQKHTCFGVLFVII